VLEFYQIQSKQWNRFRYFGIGWPIYQFISDNPQWKMERRSVNLFLRRLIGDEHFEW